MNQANQPGGLRCHDAEACAGGLRVCPSPVACGCAAPISADLRQTNHSAASATDRDTHFYLAGWNGACWNEDSQAHFRRALQAAPPAQAQDAPQAPAAPSGIAWRDSSVSSPPWTDDDSVRVIAITAQDDFGGVQVHDIRASDFYGEDTEVASVCTHWAYRDEIWPRAALAAAPAQAVAVPSAAEILARATQLHGKCFMPWTQAEEQALSEAGIDGAAIDELIGNCGSSGLDTILGTADDLREFTRSVLVHQPDHFAAAQEHATQLAGQGQALPVYELNVRGVFQDCTPLVSAFSLPDGKHQLYLAAAPVQAQEDARDADGWYLQDTRSYVGNDVLFWAQDSNGYTTDVSKAHVFTQEEAFRQAAMRGVDRAWPKAYIDGKTRPAVDMQYIDHDAAIAAQGKADAARAAQGGAAC